MRIILIKKTTTRIFQSSRQKWNDSLYNGLTIILSFGINRFKVIKKENIFLKIIEIGKFLMKIDCLKSERTLQASKTSRTNDLLFAGGIVLAPNIFRLLSSSTALLGSPLTGSVFSLLHSPSTPSCSFDNWTCYISICSIARHNFLNRELLSIPKHRHYEKNHFRVKVLL